MPKEFNVFSPIPIVGAKKVENLNLATGQPIEIFKPWQHKFIKKLLDDQKQALTQQFTSQQEQANTQAFEQGLQQGVQQTKKELEAKVEQTIKVIQTTVSQLKTAFGQLVESSEQDMLRLALSLARKVVDTEITLNPDIVLSVLRKCLKNLAVKQGVYIVLNPADIDLVNSTLTQLKQEQDLPDDVELVSNPNINQGSCRIEFATGCLDADLDTQFNELARQLLAK